MRAAPPRYTDDEQKAALELAVAIGRNQAIKKLGISHATFQRWTRRHPRFYSDLQAGDPESQRKGFAKSLEELAQEYLAVEHDGIERAEKLMPSANAKETAALIKAMGSSRQAATVGARQVMGEPDVVEHNINFPALEQAMERLLEGAQEKPKALPVSNEAEAVEV